MVNTVFALAVAVATFGQLETQQITPGKMALDMNVEAVSLLGKNLYRTPAEGDALKQLERRIAEADKHVQAQPENPATHMARGQALEAAWRYHDAAQAYTKVISLSPGDAGAYVRRGEAFLVLRLLEQAKADFEHALALDPSHAPAWRGKGIALFLAHQFEASGDAFAKAMEYFENDNIEKAFTDRWVEQLERRLGREAHEPRLRPGSILSILDEHWSAYGAGLRKLMNGDKEGAMEDWRALADSSNWPSLWVVAAEAEIAAIEGAKKMKPSV